MISTSNQIASKTGKTGTNAEPHAQEELENMYDNYRLFLPISVFLACGATSENFAQWKQRSDNPELDHPERERVNTPYYADTHATCRSSTPHKRSATRVLGTKWRVCALHTQEARNGCMESRPGTRGAPRAAGATCPKVGMEQIGAKRQTG